MGKRALHRPTRIATLTRAIATDGATLYFTFPVGGRRRVCEFVRAEDVPPFDGETATFELEKVREAGRPWPFWRAVRRIDT